MTFIDRFMIIMGHLLKANLISIREPILYILEQIALILLQTQHIISVLVADFLSDLLRASHRNNGHNTPANVQQLQKFGDCLDFVRFIVHLALAQGNAIGACPGEKIDSTHDWIPVTRNVVR